MATLLTYLESADIRVIQGEKYSSARFLNWANQILTKMSSKHVLPELEFSKGVRVLNEIWITKPANLRKVVKISSPVNSLREYGFSEENNKIKLEDAEIEEEASVDITAFTNYNVAYVDINVDDVEEDAYEDYLLVITAGTLAGETYMINRNDASAAGVTRIYFEIPLTTAFNGTSVTAGILLNESSYLVLKYWGSFPALTALSDEVPINDSDEAAIMSTGLRYMAVRHAPGSSQIEIQKWLNAYNEAINDAIDSRTAASLNPVKARPLIGLMSDQSLTSDDDEELVSEFWPVE